MPISTACPSCQQRLKLGDGLLGKRVRCPKCQQVFLVPPGQDEHVQRPIQPAERPASPAEPLVPPLRDDESNRDKPRRSRQSDSSNRDDRRDLDGAPRRKRKVASRQNNQWVYWAVGAGAGVLVLSLGCCGAGFWYYSTVSNRLHEQASVAPPANLVFPDVPQAANNPPPAQKPNRPLEQSKDRLYFNDKGFSIVPPKGWASTTPQNNKAFMQMFAGKEDYDMIRIPAGEQPFLPNFSTTMVIDGTPLATMRVQLKQIMPTQFKNWQLLDDAMVTIDGNPAYRMAMHVIFEANGVEADMDMLQYYIKGPNNKVFIVAFAAGPTRFAGLRPKFEKCADTIQID